MDPCFSVVSPVHNEEKLLPITLPSIYQLHPNEAIFSLDRCTDGSRWIIEAEARRHPETSTRILTYTESDGKNWRFRGAYLRRDAYEKARNDVILNTSADIILDPIIHFHLHRIPAGTGLISFGYLDYPYNLQSFLRIIITGVSPITGFAGLLAFSRYTWKETEDLEDLKRIRRAEDTHLHLAIRSKYPVGHVNTMSFHLRPNETSLDHYHRGVAQWEVLQNPPYKAFLHSIIMLRPAVFTGYMHARRGFAW